MYIYLIGLFILFALVLKSYKTEEKKYNSILGFIILYLALLVGLSDMLGGYDRYIYAEVFDSTAISRSDGLPMAKNSAFIQNPTELGFGMYNFLISFITGNRYIFILITTLIVYLSYYYHFTKLTKYPITAFFLFFCLFYFFTFTYLRQVMAASISWFAIPYAINRKPAKFFACVIIAAMFHNSALLFLSVYFVAKTRFSQKQIIYSIIAILLLGLTPLGTLLFSLIGGAVNEQKASGAIEHVGETRFAYIMEAAIFLLVILKGYDKLAKDKVTTCMLNISLLFIWVLLFFVRFTDAGRMSWYFIIGLCCTIAQILKATPRWNIMRVSMFGIFSYLYIRILLAWGIFLYPYKTFLTNDVRENDPTWEKYEYDHNYDYDKLYKL